MLIQTKGTIIESEIWDEIRPYIKIQCRVGRIGKIQSGSRIELRDMPNEVAVRAINFWWPCVACGKLCHPFRQRRGPIKRGNDMIKTNGIYYAPSCPSDVSLGCSRGHAASDNYDLIVREIQQKPAKPLPPRQAVLF